LRFRYGAIGRVRSACSGFLDPGREHLPGSPLGDDVVLPEFGVVEQLLMDVAGSALHLYGHLVVSALEHEWTCV
jgi:hypothetical protein